MIHSGDRDPRGDEKLIPGSPEKVTCNIHVEYVILKQRLAMLFCKGLPRTYFRCRP